jgi:hypothetical protein
MRFHIKTDSKANMFSYTRNHRRVPHISLVFCGMWDTTELPSSLLRSPQLRRGCPMFAPAYVDRKRRGRSPYQSFIFLLSLTGRPYFPKASLEEGHGFSGAISDTANDG